MYTTNQLSMNDTFKINHLDKTISIESDHGKN